MSADAIFYQHPKTMLGKKMLVYFAYGKMFSLLVIDFTSLCGHVGSRLQSRCAVQPHAHTSVPHLGTSSHGQLENHLTTSNKGTCNLKTRSHTTSCKTNLPSVHNWCLGSTTSYSTSSPPASTSSSARSTLEAHGGSQNAALSSSWQRLMLISSSTLSCLYVF